MCCSKIIKYLKANDKKACFSNKSPVAEEKGKKFIIEKKIDFCKIQYDNCLFNQSTKRVDYIFSLCKPNKNNKVIYKIIYVELKGQEITKAFKQIEETHTSVNTILNENKCTIQNIQFEAFIISRKVPKAANSKYRKLKEQFRKKHNLPINIQTIEYHYKKLQK